MSELGAVSFDVPPQCTQLLSIPAGTAIAIRTKAGKISGFMARSGNLIWFGEAHFEMGRGIVFGPVNGPVSEADYFRLCKTDFT